MLGEAKGIARLLAYPLLLMGAGSLLSALDANLVSVPRALFVIVPVVTFAAIVALVFSLVYLPIHNRSFYLLLPYGVALVLFVISVARLSSTSFFHGDEIYSWNMWAVQHYFGQPADLTYTGAAYPQLYPYWIASVYKALGSFTIHAIPRFFLAFCTLAFFVAIVCPASIVSWRMAALVSAIAVCLWGPLLMRDQLPTGMADPLMSAFLLSSVALVIAYDREPRKLGTFWLSAACAVLASLTKQPALLWGCIGLPLVAIFGCLRRRWPRKAFVIAAGAAAICVVWPLFIAPDFANNNGVIGRSMEGRSYLQQLGYAAMKYLIDKPGLGVVFAASAIAAWRHSFLRVLWIVAALPLLIAWFLFGAYQLRLGMHVVGLAAMLLIAAVAAPRPADLQERAQPASSVPFPRWAIAGLATIAVFAAAAAAALVMARVKGTDLADGNRTTFRTQFDAGSETTFDEIVRGNGRVWTTSQYSYGVFFARTTVGRPAYTSSYALADVVEDLRSFKADYALYSGKVAFGPGSELLRNLIEKCPRPFRLLLTGNTDAGGLILYKVDVSALSSCR